VVGAVAPYFCTGGTHGTNENGYSARGNGEGGWGCARSGNDGGGGGGWTSHGECPQRQIQCGRGGGFGKDDGASDYFTGGDPQSGS
jgi:hypothetical protein